MIFCQDRDVFLAVQGGVAARNMTLKSCKTPPNMTLKLIFVTYCIIL